MSKSVSITKNKKSDTHNQLLVVVNVDRHGERHSATVHRAEASTIGSTRGGRPRTGAGGRGGGPASLPPSAHGTPASSRGSRHSPRGTASPVSGSSHNALFGVVLDGLEGEITVKETGHTAEATLDGKVVWTGHSKGGGTYETTKSSLGDKTAQLVHKIHSYHLLKGNTAPASGSGSAPRAPRRATAKKTAAKKTAAKQRKTGSYVEVKAHGKVLKKYGPFPKAEAEKKKVELVALAQPGATVEIVPVKRGAAKKTPKRSAKQKAATKKAQKAAAKKREAASKAAPKSKMPGSKKPASSKNPARSAAQKSATKKAQKAAAKKREAASKAAPKSKAPGSKKPASKAASAKKPASKKTPSGAKPPKRPRAPRAKKVEPAPVSATRASARAPTEESPRTIRVPVSVGNDESVFAKLRAGIKAEKLKAHVSATEAEIDQELAQLKHAWRVGARDKVIAWMHAHEIADVAKGFDDWMKHNIDEAVELMGAPSRAA